MNTLTRVDTWITAFLVGIPPPATPPSSSKTKLSSSSEDFPAHPRISNLPPTPRKYKPGSKQRRRPRPRPTTSNIKLPPPSTPFFLRIALGLWSILLAFWRSLVGETRAERKRRTRQRADTLRGTLRRKLLDVGASAEVTSDDGSGTETEVIGNEKHRQEDNERDEGWIDPVTRAPADQPGVEEPDDDEFAVEPSIPTKLPETFTFRLRSAAEKDLEQTTINGNKAIPEIIEPIKSPPAFVRQPTPPGILSNPLSNNSSRSTTPRINRLLPNPMSTSLLDPSVPLNQSSSSTSPITSNLSSPRSSISRTHQTPFHLQKTLILDLDETLIHSTSRPMSYAASAGGGLLGLSFGGLLGGRKSRREGHTVEVVLNGRSTTYHVYKRPYVDLFLKKVANWYTLIIYTASMPEYADPVIDWLDNGRGLFAKRYYRDYCYLQPNGSYIKDLALVEQDLSRVCFMDNSPISYSWNKANALPIEGWTSDPYDEALLQSIPVLDSLRFVNDVRRILGIRGFFSSI